MEKRAISGRKALHIIMEKHGVSLDEMNEFLAEYSKSYGTTEPRPAHPINRIKYLKFGSPESHVAMAHALRVAVAILKISQRQGKDEAALARERLLCGLALAGLYWVKRPPLAIVPEPEQAHLSDEEVCEDFFQSMLAAIDEFVAELRIRPVGPIQSKTIQ